MADQIAEYIKECIEICKENGLKVRQAWANRDMDKAYSITVACDDWWCTWSLETGKVAVKPVSY